MTVTRVALDVMGGDHAPRAVVEGAKLAIDRGIAKPEQLLLVGGERVVAEEMGQCGLQGSGCTVVDAPDVLDPDDTPIDAMRRSPRNSITVGIRAVAEGHAAAFVSAGSTGAVVAAASVGLPRLEGIRRAGIAVTISGEGGVPFVVVDVGANPQPKPAHLLQYGLMGAAYYRDTFGAANPRVGLLNIGSEDSKGNPLTRGAANLLRGSGLHFVGNIEGVDVFNGRCDVVVSDGFTGNVLLKVSEGVAEYMLRTTKGMMEAAGVGGQQIKDVVGRLLQRVDYSEYGGAQLLGVRGVVTICHGRSNANAISNAVRFALKALGAHTQQHIVDAARASTGS